MFTSGNPQEPYNSSHSIDPRRPSPWRQRIGIVVIVMLLAFAGMGLFRDQLPLADADTGGNGNPAAAVTENANGTLLAAQATAAVADQDNSAMTVADVAAAANPAVVTVYNLQTVQSDNPFGIVPQTPGQGDSNEPQPIAAGSGWIYDADGHVVTNAHVVAGAEELQVQFYDGTTVKATLVGTDTVRDVAVLQLKLDHDHKVPGVAKVGDSSAMRAGDPVVAIGSPLGEYANTVSAGIIGGLHRTLATDTEGTLENLIQHDAPISSGNSGGPLLNMQGEVIGMNVAKIDSSGSQQVSASGLNFAIDGNTVVKSVKAIIASDGSIAYPYLGVQLQEAQDGTTTVVSVEPGSPADDAGLQKGDVITAVDGDALDANTSLSQLLYQHQPGDKVTLTIDRDGRTQTVDVTLGTRPDAIQ